jgi:hypothetical protein
MFGNPDLDWGIPNFNLILSGVRFCVSNKLQGIAVDLRPTARISSRGSGDLMKEWTSFL